MLRLLLALAVVGALIWWQWPHKPAHKDPVAAQIAPMMQTLKNNGCGPGPAAATNGPASLKALQSAIAECEARAAARAEAPATSH
ncbi:MAG TPA: hypothetical protein VFQ88_12620 [Nevskiaceae bacterium]|nr:hypothetical protein [Nevskiaceae bacterium]